MNRRDVGSVKEAEAEKYLINSGHVILQRNYRTRDGEIDIIAEKDEFIIFIEVKYRSTNKYGYGEESVDKKKCRKIFLVSQNYIFETKNKKNVRYDVIVVENSGIRHLEDFFWGDDIGF